MAKLRDLIRPRRMLQTLRPVGATAIVVLCLIWIGILSADVRRELDALEKLSTDNTQWALMQTEVEVLRLQLAVEMAIGKGDDAELGDLRRWFDVVYARVGMLPQSAIYAAQLQTPAFAPDVRLLRSFLDRTVPLIDGPDAELRASLRPLADMLPEIRQAARRLSLQARTDSAAASDLRRQAVTWTLIELAALVIVLFAALGGLVLLFLRLMRRSRTQMQQGSLTSARLQTIFSTSADAIIVTNRGGWIVDINPAAEAVFGHKRETTIGVHALDLFLPPELAQSQGREITAILDAAASRGQQREPLRIELLAMRADGARIPVEMSLGAMQIATGGVIVALVRDISDRRRARTILTGALEQAQAGEKTKTDFIAVMSHEMRTPLNGLLGSLDLLGTTDLNTQQRDLTNIMSSSGRILLHHVNSVLDISRAEADRAPDAPVVFDADKLIRDCVANQAGLAAAKGLEMTIAAPHGPIGKVTGDPARMRQILLNLIGNAVKFTAKGRVTIEQERPGIGDLVEIRVIDTGIGIPKADLNRVFDDFVTLDARYDRQAGGTGLGLGIARRVARAMGGEIGAESVVGDGSLFWLRLPLPAADAAAPALTGGPVRLTALPGQKALNVLVIEDNPVNRFVLRRLLEESGYRVSEAGDGAAGIAAATAEAFDLIMTDISMPGMDGVEVTRRIREQAGPSQLAKVIAVTAHALPDELIRFRDAGIDDCLTKPITRVALNDAMAGLRTFRSDSADLPVLDTKQLTELAEKIGAQQTATLIARVIAEGDAEDVDHNWSFGPDGHRRLHDLIGTAGIFGAGKLQARLTDLAAARADKNDAEIARLNAGLSVLWRSTRAALETEALALQADQRVARVV